MSKISKWLFVSILAIGLAGISSVSVFGDDATQINTNVDNSLKQFKKVPGAHEILRKASGILVFPNVFKAGIGIGGEYGEGALRIRGKTVDYYSTASASIGFQFGGQKKTIIIAFMQKDALEKFRHNTGWKVGIDVSIAVIAIGTGGSIDSSKLNEPIVAFVLDQKGLMYNLTLEGSKISKIKK